MAKSLVKWDKQLADLAQKAAGQEAGVGNGQFFSIKGGRLSLNDNRMPNDEMVCVVLDHVCENVLYAADYDPDNPSGPVCYAFGRADKDMKPHEAVAKPQSPDCADCAHNQWGSAEKGRGKACKNRRRLAIIAGGDFDPKSEEFTPYEDAEQYATQQPSYLSLPPTALNAWGAYVKKLNGSVRRPPCAVFTKISVTGDDKTQVKINFEMVDLVPDDLVPTMLKAAEAAEKAIIFPYPAREDAKPAKKKAGKKRF